MCRVNGSTLRPSATERNPLHPQTGNERDVTAEPVELGHGNFTPGLLGRLQRGLQLRPPVERIAALARLDLGELGDDLEAFGLGKAGNSLALGFKAEARAALLLGRDAVISNQGRHIRGSMGLSNQRLYVPSESKVQEELRNFLQLTRTGAGGNLAS